LKTFKSLDFPSPTLRSQIGQMLMVGFGGTSPEDEEVKKVSELLQNGDLGNIIFFAYNLESPDQVSILTHNFKKPTLIHSHYTSY